VPHDDDPNHELHDLASNPKSGGIFPGRCGDTSPHKGVLNLPLGAKVMAHDVGTALVRHVSPRVEAFAPDLIVLSAGFDAHRNDPMGLGSLSAKDFGHITEVVCQLAFNTCSGRVISVLEGGYGVPCCRPQKETGSTTSPAPGPAGSSARAGGEFDASKAEEPSNDVACEQTQPSSLTTGSEVVVIPAEPGRLPPESTRICDGVENAKSEAEQQRTESTSDCPADPGTTQRPQPTKLCDLGVDLPNTMDDQVPYALQRRLEKCHGEGFIECVREHVESLAR